MSRAHGRITVVWTKDLGTTLTQDEAAGATVLHVDDVAPFNDDEVFDEDGNLGYLQVGAQTVGYTAVDDDASMITLAAALAADASQDDDVLVWDDLYGEVDTQQWAWVEPDGGDRQDPYEVEVDDSFELVDGDRGKRGESCTIRRLPGSDVWTLVHVSGRPSKARGIRFESDDVYTLTTADIAAGSATLFLTHRPVDESVKLWWRTVAQEPTEYTVDYDAQTITLPLTGCERVGDRLWVHYSYRKGLGTLQRLSIPLGYSWRYATGLGSSTTYAATGFDDSAWSSGPTPFGWGDTGVPATWATTVPQPMDVWHRITVESFGGDLTFSWADVDDDAYVYLDGVLVGEAHRTSGASGENAGSFTAAATAGSHVIAVHGTDLGDTDAFTQKGYVGFAIQESA